MSFKEFGNCITCVLQYPGDLELCLDVGCGNGQCSGLFSSSFRKVLATDISPSQIEVAKTLNYPTNVDFQ
jgi:2-polyprenyl-3-methyl-5-hydroxy-6-metoxy-1,4-benzoquinol methylase